jgi:hypothetical protein
VILVEKRVWIKSGVVEELDAKQERLIHLVFEKIQFYYRHLYRTRPCYQYPLSLARLMKLCQRSGHAVVGALRILANTIPAGTHDQPPIYYDRAQAQRNKSHRPYRIFLRQQQGHAKH